MEMRKHLQEIFKVCSQDETLLRLLIYKPDNSLDDPLDKTKPNILDKSETEKWSLINDRIKFTPSVHGLDQDNICRLLFYPAPRTPNRNHLSPTQDIKFDVLAHYEFNDIDMRMSWICDRIHELMNQKRISGFGKVRFVRGQDIGTPVDGYIGYRLTYEFGELE
jgi:hypothetical protein